MADRIPEPELGRDAGYGGRTRVHRRVDGRVHRGRWRYRQDLVAIPDAVGDHRPAGDVADKRHAVSRGCQRHRRDPFAPAPSPTPPPAQGGGGGGGQTASPMRFLCWVSWGGGY